MLLYLCLARQMLENIYFIYQTLYISFYSVYFYVSVPSNYSFSFYQQTFLFLYTLWSYHIFSRYSFYIIFSFLFLILFLFFLSTFLFFILAYHIFFLISHSYFSSNFFSIFFSWVFLYTIHFSSSINFFFYLI